MEGDSKLIAILDIGTTKIKCMVLNKNLDIVSSTSENVKLLYSDKGGVEIDPEQLWESIKNVMTRAFYNETFAIGKIENLGISTQRATFITWNKNTGEPFHNLITWKDLRCAQIVQDYNNSISLRSVRAASYMLHLVTRKKKFLLGSKFKLECNHVTSRLLWALQNFPQIRREIKKNNVMFGTLDTWLLYKLTGGETYVTDISNASATGLFDPFDLTWSKIIERIFDIPLNILPPVVSNDSNFGKTDIFKTPITISTVIADQSASAIGSKCFNLNDAKVTLGTGAFLDVNTRDSIHAGLNGMYPLIGWKIKDATSFLTEAPCNDAGSLIEWLMHAGYVTDINHLNSILQRTKDSEGVYFISAFSGLGPPINNPKAGSGFIGVTPKTTTDHMVLSVIESIVFKITLAFRYLKSNTNVHYKKICVDGGVSKSDFICQMLADINKIDVERADFPEIGALGVAFIISLKEGGIHEKDDLLNLRKVEKTFHCNYTNFIKYDIKLKKWREAADRFLSWK